MPEDKDVLLVKELMKRQHQLEKEREPYEDIWDEVSYFGAARRPDFKNKSKLVKKHGTQIYDGTPASALNLYVDGILGYYVSRNLEWFNYRIGGYQLQGLNEVKEVRNWLQQIKEAVYWELNRSNFYDAIREFLLDGASIGNANLFIDENLTDDSIDFLVRHPRELWYMERSNGSIDVIHRKFKLTAKQAVNDFGKENVSVNIRNAYENNRMNEEYEFIHAICPKNDLIPQEYDSKISKSKNFWEYVSYYFEADKKNLLRRGGYRTLNPVIWRMEKYSGESYGRGLLGNAISEVKRLNSASKTEMEVAQLSAEPAMNIPFEMKDDVDLTPHGQNYYRDAGRIIQPIQSGANYPITEDYITRLQTMIERHFKVEFFLMLARSEGTMTATEIIEKQGEKVALMTSQLGLLANALNKIHNRLLNIMYEQKKIPTDIPSVILEQTGGFFDLDVQYVGPLAEAQKRLFKARGIRQSLEVAAPYIEMFPGILDTLDDVALAKKLFTSHGMPSDVIRDDEEIQRIRQQRAQQQQQAFLMEMAEKEAKMASNLGKEVSDKSVLKKMAEQNGQE